MNISSDEIFNIIVLLDDTFFKIEIAIPCKPMIKIVIEIIYLVGGTFTQSITLY